MLCPQAAAMGEPPRRFLSTRGDIASSTAITDGKRTYHEERDG
jgi:hypothetical protein